MRKDRVVEFAFEEWYLGLGGGTCVEDPDTCALYNLELGKDLELFAQHAGRKSVNMEDVILSDVPKLGEQYLCSHTYILKLQILSGERKEEARSWP
ncbi:hypothetical protein FRX31_017751, partial [Thalictrum thalictroides]